MVEYDFNDFQLNVPVFYQKMTKDIHDFLIDSGCIFELKKAASGPVASYSIKKPKQVLFNFVFRKTDLYIRVYSDSLNSYLGFIASLPGSVKKLVKKSSNCKRLMNPADCNQKCKMGYTFELDGETQKKCRYNCFLFPVNDETEPFIKPFIENELKGRIQNA